MDRMSLEEKIPRAHDADAVDVRVVGTLPHDHDLLVVVSYRLQRGDLSLPGLACEHLVSRLRIEHTPVLRRGEVDFFAIELAHMHAPPFVEQLEIHGVLEQAASIRDPIAGHPGPEAGVDDILLRVRLEERLAVQIVSRGIERGPPLRFCPSRARDHTGEVGVMKEHRHLEVSIGRFGLSPFKSCF